MRRKLSPSTLSESSSPPSSKKLKLSIDAPLIRSAIKLGTAEHIQFFICDASSTTTSQHVGDDFLYTAHFDWKSIANEYIYWR